MEDAEVKKIASLSAMGMRRALNNLMGIVAGICCDNQLTESEVRFLANWIQENQAVATLYPANIICRKVSEVMADGAITTQERNQLLDDLKVLSGTHFLESGSALPSHIESIFDDDPTVIFPQRLFVLTGQFIFGTRAACERAIMRRGGWTASNVTRKTNYLVVGDLCSPDWIEQNFGTKIQKAAKLVEKAEDDISIIRERDWAMAMNDIP